jgi:hypothetical protein
LQLLIQYICSYFPYLEAYDENDNNNNNNGDGDGSDDNSIVIYLRVTSTAKEPVTK